MQYVHDVTHSITSPVHIKPHTQHEDYQTHTALNQSPKPLLLQTQILNQSPLQDFIKSSYSALYVQLKHDYYGYSLRADSQ